MNELPIEDQLRIAREELGRPRPEMNGADADEERIKVLNIKQFLEKKIPAPKPLLSPVIFERDTVMIYSWRGTGKTHLGLSLAYAIASGGELLGWEAPEPQPVLYVDGEMSEASLQQRVAHIVAGCAKEPPNPNYLRLITPDCQDFPLPNLSLREGQDRIDEILGDARVVIFDSISTLFHGGKENEGESWLPAQAWALRLRRKGLCCIFQHHAGKGGSQRGTSRREDILNVVIHLVHPPDHSPTEGARFEVHFEKGRDLVGGALKPFEAQLHVDKDKGTATWTKRDIEGAKYGLAVEMFKMGMTVRDIADELKISKSAAHRLREQWQKSKKAGGE